MAICGKNHPRQLQKVTYNTSVPTISDLADGIKNMRRYYAGQPSPFGETIIRKVESLFPELISSQKEVYLLHGDLHHGNILQSYSGWKLIDPKGVVGETEYELIPFLMNQLQTDSEYSDKSLPPFRSKVYHLFRVKVYHCLHTGITKGTLHNFNISYLIFFFSMTFLKALLCEQKLSICLVSPRR